MGEWADYWHKSADDELRRTYLLVHATQKPAGVSRPHDRHPCMNTDDHATGWWPDADGRWWLCPGFHNPREK